MPDLDVSEVVTDPDFAETFTVTSVTKNITSGGVSVQATSAVVQAYGVVTPGKANLRRLDDGTRISAYIDVYTTFPLTTGWRITDATERVADLVTWKGSQYTVSAVENWADFGFIHASCDLLPLNPATPQ